MGCVTVARVRRGPARRLLVGLLALLLGTAVAGGLVLIDAFERSDAEEVDGSDHALFGRDYYANPAAVCGLLDPDDLELALGFPFAPGFEAPIDTPALTLMPGIVRCYYPSEEQSGGWVAVGVAYAYAEQVFNRTAEAREERNFDHRRVAGIGDGAFWSGGDLLVLTDGKLVGVHIAGHFTLEEDRLEQTRRLTEKVLERLQ